MKKVFATLMIALMGGLMTLPVVNAQSRPGRGGSSSSTVGSRPGRSDGSSNRRPSAGPSQQRPGGGTNVRPGNDNKPEKPGQGVRPSTPSTRPSTPATRPSAPSNRPSGPSVRPSTPPNRPSGPAVRPSAPHMRPGTVRPSRPTFVTPPVRPGRPVYSVPWTRPVPPASWRPARRFSVVPNILGMTLGVTINSALDYLYTSGYSVDGYGSQEVYLRNVSELGYRWDDATLYFSGNGLVRSQFYDSSSGYSTSRFNSVYDTLYATYGLPVSQSNSGGQITASWFGYQGDYITLQYCQLNTSAGLRYFTILTYGS